MSAFMIALFISLGASAWVYNKVMGRTGGNTQNAMVVTGVVAVMSFVIVLTILKIIDNYLN